MNNIDERESRSKHVERQILERRGEQNEIFKMLITVIISNQDEFDTWEFKFSISE